MKKILAALLFVVSACSFAQIVMVPIPGAPGLSIAVGTGVNALPLQNIKDNPNAVNITMPDDSWQEVPLQFNFPYFGQQFNRSWMLSNGVVGFRDPATTGAWGMCCSGLNLTTLNDTRYNYSIMPLWTDLIAIEGGSHYYLSEPNKTTYGWYGVSEFYNANNRNSFEVDINSSGVINTRIGQALVTNHYVTSGMTGDLSKGEYYQYYHGYGLNIPSGAGISWSAPGGTGIDQCIINPLYNPSCPGYADAYKTQQCSINTLYDPTCPGYQQAYFNQQCSLNSLYNESCPGYQQAYFTQQCTANPLYNSNCPGYARAYFNQQCSLSALYDPACPGYSTAYQAYLRERACTANPQSSPTCSGYRPPQNNTNNQANGGQTTNESNVGGVVISTNSSDGNQTRPQIVSDSNVNRVITSTATSTSPNAPGAAVQLTSQPSQQQQQTMGGGAMMSTQGSSQSSGGSNQSQSSGSSERQNTAAVASSEQRQEQRQERQEQRQEQSQENQRSAENSSQSSQQADNKSSSSQQNSEKAPSRQERMEAAKKDANNKGNNAIKESGEAKSMNAQVATQGLVVAAMGFNPSFDVYQSVVLRDVSFYKPLTIYGGQKNVDNARVSRRLFGATDQLHNQMVQSQYELGK